MNKSIMPFLLALGSILASGIQAQESPVEFLSCALLDDDIERLSCFDRELTRQLLTSRQQPAVMAAPDTATAAAAAATAVATKMTHQEADSLPATIPHESAAVGLAEAAPTAAVAAVAEEQFGNPRLSDLEQITLTVTRVGRRPHGEHIVYLDNGQVWSEQTKSSYFPVNAGETVTIRKRKYGGYRLITESGKAYDVERLR